MTSSGNISLGALESEYSHEIISTFAENNQSSILPIIGRTDVRIGKQVSRDRQPIREKLLHEQKPVDLVYDTNLSQVR